MLATIHLLLVGVALVSWLRLVGGTDQVWRADFLPRVMQVARIVDFPSAQLADAMVESLGLSTNPDVKNALDRANYRQFILMTYWTPLILCGTIQWWLIGFLIQSALSTLASRKTLEVSDAESR